MSELTPVSAALHSYWSASGFEATRLCPGKQVLSLGRPDDTNTHAASGTATHQLLTWALQDKCPADRWIGTTISLNAQGRVMPEDHGDEPVAYAEKVDRERAERAQSCIDFVLEAAGEDGTLLIDRKVNYAKYLGVDRDTAWGTLDVAVVRGSTLYVVDYKDGRGYVAVGNDEDGPNDQLALYALGMIDELSAVQDFDEVVLVISQPRIDEVPSTYRTTVAALEAWAEKVARPAVRSSQVAADTYRSGESGVMAREWEDTFLKPGDKQCGFCKAYSVCPAVRDEVGELVSGNRPATPDEFEVVERPVELMNALADDPGAWLAKCLSKVDLVEGWCKAVRTEAERRLLAGEDVPGYKLVQGKQGNRAWSDPAEAEKVLKSMRLKDADMYDFTLISPTTAEKLAPKFDKDGKVKPVKAGAPEPLIGPRQWVKLQGLITRKPGSPHVAPLTDGREPLKLAPVTNDFDVIEGAVTEVPNKQEPTPDAQAVTVFDPNDFA